MRTSIAGPTSPMVLEARSQVDPSEIPDGHTVGLDAFCNPSSAAVPLPLELFDGPRDRIWRFDAGVASRVQGSDEVGGWRRRADPAIIATATTRPRARRLGA